MQYELVRSNRKTLALLIDRSGQLTVRAPLRMPAAQIEAFLFEKQRWIAKTLARLSALPPQAEPLTLRDGASIPYFGRVLTLRLTDAARVTLAGDTLLIPSKSDGLDSAIRFLESQTRQALTLQVSVLSQRLCLAPKTIRLTRARGRWGSMSMRGTLSLNRALMHCPPDIIDYVIIHELCHIAHPNHSAAFWATVERFLPDYRMKRDWLKTRNSLINILPC